MIRLKTVVTCDDCGSELVWKGMHDIKQLKPKLEQKGWEVHDCEKTICGNCVECRKILKQPHGTD